MGILILTVLISLLLLVRIGISVRQRGWTNLYIAPLSLVLASLILSVVGFLA